MATTRVPSCSSQAFFTCRQGVTLSNGSNQDEREGPKGKSVSFLLEIIDLCKSFLKQFKRKRNISFETFKQLWLQLKFYDVIIRTPTFLRPDIYFNQLLQVAKSFCLPPNSLSTRMRAMYLLHGIYSSLNFNYYPFKIKVQSQDFQHLKRFEEKMKNNGHQELIQIMADLLQADSLDFCLLLPEDFCVTRTERRKVEVAIWPAVNHKTPEDLFPRPLRKFKNSPALKDIISSETGYMNYKKKILEKIGTPVDSENSGIGQTLTNDFYMGYYHRLPVVKQTRSTSTATATQSTADIEQRRLVKTAAPSDGSVMQPVTQCKPNTSCSSSVLKNPSPPKRRGRPVKRKNLKRYNEKLKAACSESSDQVVRSELENVANENTLNNIKCESESVSLNNHENDVLDELKNLLAKVSNNETNSSDSPCTDPSFQIVENKSFASETKSSQEGADNEIFILNECLSFLPDDQSSKIQNSTTLTCSSSVPDNPAPIKQLPGTKDKPLKCKLKKHVRESKKVCHSKLESAASDKIQNNIKHGVSKFESVQLNNPKNAVVVECSSLADVSNKETKPDATRFLVSFQCLDIKSNLSGIIVSKEKFIETSGSQERTDNEIIVLDELCSLLPDEQLSKIQNSDISTENITENVPFNVQRKRTLKSTGDSSKTESSPAKIRKFQTNHSGTPATEFNKEINMRPSMVKLQNNVKVLSKTKSHMPAKLLAGKVGKILEIEANCSSTLTTPQLDNESNLEEISNNKSTTSSINLTNSIEVDQDQSEIPSTAISDIPLGSESGKTVEIEFMEMPSIDSKEAEMTMEPEAEYVLEDSQLSPSSLDLTRRHSKRMKVKPKRYIVEESVPTTNKKKSKPKPIVPKVRTAATLKQGVNTEAIFYINQMALHFQQNYKKLASRKKKTKKRRQIHFNPQKDLVLTKGYDVEMEKKIWERCQSLSAHEKKSNAETLKRFLSFQKKKQKMQNQDVAHIAVSSQHTLLGGPSGSSRLHTELDKLLKEHTVWLQLQTRFALDLHVTLELTIEHSTVVKTFPLFPMYSYNCGSYQYVLLGSIGLTFTQEGRPVLRSLQHLKGLVEEPCSLRNATKCHVKTLPCMQVVHEMYVAGYNGYPDSDIGMTTLENVKTASLMYCRTLITRNDTFTPPTVEIRTLDVEGRVTVISSAGQQFPSWFLNIKGAKELTTNIPPAGRTFTCDPESAKWIANQAQLNHNVINDNTVDDTRPSLPLNESIEVLTNDNTVPGTLPMSESIRAPPYSSTNNNTILASRLSLPMVPTYSTNDVQVRHPNGRTLYLNVPMDDGRQTMLEVNILCPVEEDVKGVKPALTDTRDYWSRKDGSELLSRIPNEVTVNPQEITVLSEEIVVPAVEEIHPTPEVITSEEVVLTSDEEDAIPEVVYAPVENTFLTPTEKARITRAKNKEKRRQYITDAVVKGLSGQGWPWQSSSTVYDSLKWLDFKKTYSRRNSNLTASEWIKHRKLVAKGVFPAKAHLLFGKLTKASTDSEKKCSGKTPQDKNCVITRVEQTSTTPKLVEITSSDSSKSFSMPEL